MASQRANLGKSMKERTQSRLTEIDENMETENQKSMKKQIDHSDVKTRASMFSTIQCPSCNRKFGRKAADDHIKYC